LKDKIKKKIKILQKIAKNKKNKNKIKIKNKILTIKKTALKI
jgi:hypothetical protein